MRRDQIFFSALHFSSIIVPLLQGPGEVPVAPAALMVSWAGLTTFASGLYHAMSRVGGAKERKTMFQSKGKTKGKASDERKTTNNKQEP